MLGGIFPGVEGLRPKRNKDRSMGFELQDGIFKKFVAYARKDCEDYENSQKTVSLAKAGKLREASQVRDGERYEPVR